jgi:hypothetical protein
MDQQPCCRCGKACDGVQITPGCVSQICAQCYLDDPNVSDQEVHRRDLSTEHHPMHRVKGKNASKRKTPATPARKADR